jgi:hypothetical protein
LFTLIFLHLVSFSDRSRYVILRNALSGQCTFRRVFQQVMLSKPTTLAIRPRSHKPLIRRQTVERQLDNLNYPNSIQRREFEVGKRKVPCTHPNPVCPTHRHIIRRQTVERQLDNLNYPNLIQRREFEVGKRKVPCTHPNPVCPTHGHIWAVMAGLAVG